MLYRIKNWAKYQHYKDRNPPWIKLHWELLTSMDWVTLNDASRVLAVACMLVASRNDGEIRGDEAGLKYLERVAHLNAKPNLNPLIDCGFLECASTMLATCKQNARPETETQLLTETETPIAPNDSANRPRPKVTWEESGFQIPDSVRNGFVTAYPAVAVDAEIAKAHAWTLANPDNRKSQWGRFLNGWLQRAQNSAPTVRKPTSATDNPIYKGVTW